MLTTWGLVNLANTEPLNFPELQMLHLSHSMLHLTACASALCLTAAWQIWEGSFFLKVMGACSSVLLCMLVLCLVRILRKCKQ